MLLKNSTNNNVRHNTVHRRRASVMVRATPTWLVGVGGVISGIVIANFAHSILAHIMEVGTSVGLAPPHSG